MEYTFYKDSKRAKAYKNFSVKVEIVCTLQTAQTFSRRFSRYLFIVQQPDCY